MTPPGASGDGRTLLLTDLNAFRQQNFNLGMAF